MKRQSFIFLAVSTFVVLVGFFNANAQVSDNYYYNNFDSGNFGTGVTPPNTNASLSVSNSSPLSGAYSLSSLSNGVPSAYQIAALPSNTSLNTETYGWEWTLVYKNTGGNTDNSTTMLSQKNSWRYWVFADNNDVNDMKGYYLTQNGSNLELRLRVSQYDTRTLMSVNLSSISGTDAAYVIRLQRLNRAGSYVWQLFLDPYTATKTEATTVRGGLNYNANNFSNYNYSGLEVVSTAAGRFKFDELKLYSMKLLISGANTAANGISNPLYAGQQNAVIYGLKVETRGLFDMYQFKLDLTGNITSIIDNATVKLNKSVDSYFGNNDDSWILNFSSGDVYNTAIQYHGSTPSPFVSFATTGNVDGSIATAGYLFLSANVLASPSTTNSFTITGAPKLVSSASGANYADNTGSVVNTSTGNANSGIVRDWTGSISEFWNVSGNWSPAGVPGVNDMARIGVVAFSSNRNPIVNSNESVGNVMIGNATAADLTVNQGFKLTINNSLENQTATTLKGNGTIDVKGTVMVKPIGNVARTTTSTIAALNTTNLMLNSLNAGTTFNLNGGTLTIKTALQTSGTNSLAFSLANDAVIKFNDPNPLVLSGSPTISFSNGTVAYASSSTQYIPTSYTYKNLSFSDAGQKIINAGTLTVTGNWTSDGGKVNFASNGTSMVFSGTNQNITDAGSDNGNGVVFGNVSFSGGGTKTFAGNGKFSVDVNTGITLAASTVVNAAGKLTLKASAAGSAYVNAIPSTSSIQGQVTVERFVQGGNKGMWRTYRMLSSPVYDNTTSFINTDVVGNRTYSFTQFIDDIIVTGTGGATNGFDNSPNNSASAWTYNNAFVNVTNINTSINVGRGAYLFYRGNRDNLTAKFNSPYVDPESTIVTFKGVLNQQNVSVPLVHGSSGLSLVGNPYACTIDWSNVVKNNVGNIIRIFNPSNRQYSTFDGQNGVNGGVKYIGPGQSFFIQTTSTSAPSITFTESSKVSVATNVSKYNKIMAVNEDKLQASSSKILSVGTVTMEETLPSKIRLRLERDGTENSDETLVVLASGNDANFTTTDIERYGGEAVFLSSLSTDAKELAINYMPAVQNLSSVKLGVNVTNNGAYTLKLALVDFPAGFEAKLLDKYLNTVTDIKTDSLSYPLSIDRTNAASFGTGRFEVLLAPVTTLPVTITDFSAVKKNEGVLLTWKTSAETNHSHFEVYRAGEDKAYVSIGKVDANQLGAYSFSDKSPLPGNNYYKLVQVDFDGTKNPYKNEVAVNFNLNAANASNLVVFPTQVQSHFTLKYNGSLQSNTYLINISDVSGKEVYTLKADKDMVTSGAKGELAAVPTGVYFVTLVDAATSKKIGSAKLIKQ